MNGTSVAFDEWACRRKIPEAIHEGSHGPERPDQPARERRVTAPAPMASGLAFSAWLPDRALGMPVNLLCQANERSTVGGRFASSRCLFFLLRKKRLDSVRSSHPDQRFFCPGCGSCLPAVEFSLSGKSREVTKAICGASRKTRLSFKSATWNAEVRIGAARLISNSLLLGRLHCSDVYEAQDVRDCASRAQLSFFFRFSNFLHRLASRNSAKELHSPRHLSSADFSV